MRPALTATAAAMLAFGTLGGCSGGPSLTSGGHELTGMDDSLSAIDATWRATFAGAGPTVNLPASAGCYVEATEADTVGQSVICGPVRLAGDGETTFQSHLVSAAETAGGWGVVLDRSGGKANGPVTFTPGAQPSSADRFVDVDGAQAPFDEALDPPALDRATVDDPVPLNVPFEGAQTVTARTPAGPVSLRVQRTSGVIGPPEHQLQPPTGGSLLLVKSATLPDAAADGADLSVTISHEGSHVRLLQEQLGDGLVIGLPDTAGRVTVDVGYGGGVQRFDASTGRRLGDPAASFYDNIGATAKATCPAVTTSRTLKGRSDGRWQQNFHCVSTLTRGSYLPPPEAGSPRTVHGWAGDGQTWVVLAIEPDERTSWAAGRARTQYTPTYFSFGTTLRVAGTAHAPRQLYVEQAHDGRPASVNAVFEVPAGERSMALSSFVTTTLAEPKGGAKPPVEGAFTYPADATFTFSGATP